MSARSLKNFVKTVYTLLLYPFLLIGNKKIRFPFNVFIGRGAYIKGKKFLFIDKNVRIGRNLEIRCFPEFGGEKYCPKIEIESGCYLGDRLKILCNANVIIKRNVLMASDIFISTENHGVEVKSGIGYGQQPLSSKNVEIGENCWIGEKVIILPGVCIGKWSIVGAGAVVTKSVPAFCMVAGNPAKIIKRYNNELQQWEKI